MIDSPGELPTERALHSALPALFATVTFYMLHLSGKG